HGIPDLPHGNFVVNSDHIYVISRFFMCVANNERLQMMESAPFYHTWSRATFRNITITYPCLAVLFRDKAVKFCAPMGCLP
ncbi:14598_t:CDS:1, partial [Gigaspora rosea]